MPNSIDTALQGLRDASAGLVQFGKNRSAAKDREAQYGAKQDEADAKAERLKAAGLEVDKIKEEFDADPENFDSAKLAKVTNEFHKVSGGNSELENMLTDLRNYVSESNKTKRAAAAQETTKAVAAKKDAKDQAGLDAKSRDEERTIKEAHYKKSDRTRIVETAYDDVIKLLDDPNDSATSNNLALTLVAKIGDPTTGVKQEEFKTAQDAKSWFENTVEVDEKTGEGRTAGGGVLPSSLVQIFQKIDPKKRGAYLTPSQKSAIKDAMGTIYEGQLGRQEAIDNETLSDVKRTPGADPYRVIGTPAGEKLKAFRAKKEEAAKAKQKSDALKLDPKESSGPKKKVVGKKWFQQAYDANLKAVTPAIQADEAAAGRKFTDQEKQKIILKKLNDLGYTFDPNLE